MNQIVVEIFGVLVVFVQVITFILDADPAYHTFKKLWSGEVSDSFPLPNLDQDFLIFFPRDQMDHFHMSANDVTRMLDFFVA